jgi:hypothetical protein
MTLEVRGREHSWTFPFDGDPDHLADWRADGLEVHVIEATIPYAIAGTPLMRPWVWLQGVWQWLKMW